MNRSTVVKGTSTTSNPPSANSKKRDRLNRSCDHCLVRHIRCIRRSTTTSSVSSAPELNALNEPCAVCVQQNLICSVSPTEERQILLRYRTGSTGLSKRGKRIAKAREMFGSERDDGTVLQILTRKGEERMFRNELWRGLSGHLSEMARLIMPAELLFIAAGTPLQTLFGPFEPKFPPDVAEPSPLVVQE
ncbi:hypothetical protein BT69DRAFT_335340 [Atractiella rhizophila]|nr:hypothetical protein BT69DRAFT_335340 [Atractiella rhizophila]